MALVYLGLGTNIGNKRKNMVTAAADVLSLSSFYETEPWGFASENTFLNAALELETACSPMELLHLTQQIEREMGRTQKSDGSYHDRIIDIDILLYGNEVVHHEDLVVPHSSVCLSCSHWQRSLLRWFIQFCRRVCMICIWIYWTAKIQKQSNTVNELTCEQMDRLISFDG